MMWPRLPVSLFLAIVSLADRAPTLEVRLSASNVSVGERFQVIVEARGPRGTSYAFPKEIGDGSVELVQSRGSIAQSNAAVYDAQVFAIGDAVAIPEIAVSYVSSDGTTGETKSVPVPLNVISTLDPKETNPTPAPLAPPMPILVARAFWIASGAAGILLIVGLALLIRRLRFPKKPVDPTLTPAISPEEDALHNLDQLVSARASTDPKTFYIRLVQILKQYLERRLEAPILEMTSSETLAFVKNHDWTVQTASSLRELVTSADLVKFGGSSDASKADRQIQIVRDLVGRVDHLRRAELDRQNRALHQAKRT